MPENVITSLDYEQNMKQKARDKDIKRIADSLEKIAKKGKKSDLKNMS